MIFARKKQLPNWFGKNADALWDMLTGYIETPCEFVFTGFNKNENIYNDKKLELIFKCFSDAKKQHPNKYFITFKE